VKSDTIRRRASNLSLDAGLIAEAKALDINVSRAAEEGLARAVAAEKTRRWKEENREALGAWNAYVEKEGLPLADLRDAVWRDTTSS
jgi:antitoxin CcdA